MSLVGAVMRLPNSDPRLAGRRLVSIMSLYIADLMGGIVRHTRHSGRSKVHSAVLASPVGEVNALITVTFMLTGSALSPQRKLSGTTRGSPVRLSGGRLGI